MNAHRAAELAARNAYGRLIAYLAVRSHDVAAAEDALSEAFLAALKSWPARGVPRNPEAWLLTSARRKLIDGVRRNHAHTKAVQLLDLEGFDFPDECSEPTEAILFPDERLKLLFICAHPAIAPTLHTPLMLQTVLGMNAQQIGSAFLVAPTTMGQRLVRAKAKIKHAGIPFELPNTEELPERAQAVLEAIYAAYTHAWNDASSSDAHPQNLTEEAIWLAQLCVQLLPNEPEAKGLLALMLYCESRHSARRSRDSLDEPQIYVPLSEQDTSLWSRSHIQAAEQTLKQASKHQRLGRFQLEAAIQSIHAQRAITDQTDWPTLVQLYEGLLQLAPTVGALLGKAYALTQTGHVQQSLTLLDSLPTETIQNHQPYWATRAYLLKQSDQPNLARQAYSQAIGLTQEDAVRAFLLQQSATLPAAHNQANDSY